jgi:hypothetical protein
MLKRSVGVAVAVGLNLFLGLNHTFNLSATGGEPLVQLQPHFGGVSCNKAMSVNNLNIYRVYAR